MKKYTLKNDYFNSNTSGGLMENLMIKFNNLLNPELSKERKSVQFVYANHLFKDEIENFKSITSYLVSNFKVVSYSEAINLLKTGDIDDNYICFSFDDGMKNNMRLAEHFNQLGITAMFFLNPKVVDNFDNEAYIEKHCRERLNMQELDFMGWHDINLLLKMGHEIGNHTMSHRRLSAETKEEWFNQIVLGKERIEKHAGKVQHFAMPYGVESEMLPELFQLAIQNHESVASEIRGQHFNIHNLKKNFIFRDQIIFKNSLSHFKYFYNKENKG